MHVYSVIFDLCIWWIYIGIYVIGIYVHVDRDLPVALTFNYPLFNQPDSSIII